MRRSIRTLAALATATALMVAMAVPAMAASSNCWGVVSSQAATSSGGLGDHSSSQATPRLGLGNTARALGFDSVADLGAFLATVDGNEATFCE